jgi:hypothetical protein
MQVLVSRDGLFEDNGEAAREDKRDSLGGNQSMVSN